MIFSLLMYTIKFSQFGNFENKNLAEIFWRSRLVESFWKFQNKNSMHGCSFLSRTKVNQLKLGTKKRGLISPLNLTTSILSHNWHLIIGSSIEGAPVCGFIPTAPLLEKERHTCLLALALNI